MGLLRRICACSYRPKVFRASWGPLKISLKTSRLGGARVAEGAVVVAIGAVVVAVVAVAVEVENYGFCFI
jgi:polyribonucleotide nucleotidyltransferase